MVRVARCAAYNCKNSSHGRRENGKKISWRFYSFPKDKDKVNKWMSNMGVKYVEEFEKCLKFHKVLDQQGQGVTALRLCHEHFTDGSYERDLKAELCGSKRRYVLKDDAVPTLFPHRYDEAPVEYHATTMKKNKSPSKMTRRQLTQVVRFNFESQSWDSKHAKRSKESESGSGTPGAYSASEVPNTGSHGNGHDTCNLVQKKEPVLGDVDHTANQPFHYRSMKSLLDLGRIVWYNSDSGILLPNAMVLNEAQKNSTKQESRPRTDSGANVPLSVYGNSDTQLPSKAESADVQVKVEPGVRGPGVSHMDIDENDQENKPVGHLIKNESKLLSRERNQQPNLSLSPLLAPGTTKPSLLTSPSYLPTGNSVASPQFDLTTLTSPGQPVLNIASPSFLSKSVSEAQSVPMLQDLIPVPVMSLPDSALTTPVPPVMVPLSVFPTSVLPAQGVPSTVTSTGQQLVSNVSHPGGATSVLNVQGSRNTEDLTEWMPIKNGVKSLQVNVSVPDGRQMAVTVVDSTAPTPSPLNDPLSNQILSQVSTSSSADKLSGSAHAGGNCYVIHSQTKLDQSSIDEIMKSVLGGGGTESKAQKPNYQVKCLNAKLKKDCLQQKKFAFKSHLPGTTVKMLTGGGSVDASSSTGNVKVRDLLKARGTCSNEKVVSTDVVKRTPNSCARTNAVRPKKAKLDTQCHTYHKKFSKEAEFAVKPRQLGGKSVASMPGYFRLINYTRTPLEEFIENIPRVTPPVVKECHQRTDGKSCDLFRCDLCLKYFPTDSLLLAHKVKHVEHEPELHFEPADTNREVFRKQCKFCDRAFFLHENLVTHQFLVHDVESDRSSPLSHPNRCGVCGKSCRDAVAMHMRTVHNDIFFRCPFVCSFRTKNFLNMKKHARRYDLKQHAIRAKQVQDV